RLGEDMRQGQEQVGDVVRPDDPELLGDPAAGGHVAMGEHAALGPAGRAGGVDDQGRVVWLCAWGRPLGLRRVTVTATRAEVLKAGGRRGSRVDDYCMPQLGQPVTVLLD